MITIPIGFLLILPFVGLDTLPLVSDFGEYRPLFRFHMGWDFSTAGHSIPLVAQDTLRVLRIRASHWGYGKAIYVEDREGRRWVAAHLDRLHPVLEQQLQTWQRAQKRIAVNGWLDPPWVFAPGETLAWTGWTGNVDPHLHLELRDTAWRPIHPSTFLDYPRPHQGRIQIRALQILPLSSESRIEGEGLTRRFRPPFPDTIWVSGPFGIWIRVRVRIGSYTTVPKEVQVRSNGEPLFHVRLDTLDWANLQEAAFLYAADGRWFSDLWIRLYGWPPPPHYAFRRSPSFYQVASPTPLEIIIRHPLAKDSVSLVIAPGEGHGQGEVVWDTLNKWYIQAHPWGVALWDGVQSQILWVNEPTRIYTSTETLQVVFLQDSSPETLSIQPHLRVHIPEEGLIHPTFAVLGHGLLRPRTLPLRKPLDIIVDPPWVAGRWKNGRWIAVGRVDRWWSIQIRQDTLPPRLQGCEVLRDRIRAYVQDDGVGWDPDSTIVLYRGQWWPFQSHASKGWLDVLDLRRPNDLVLILADGMGRRRTVRCP